jgi:hypothetical protein
LLYKVSAPRDDLIFLPRAFWRSADWSVSDDKPHADLIEDSLLFAGRFDVVNLHLLPNVWRLRVWLDDEARVERLAGLGYHAVSGAKALVFARETDRAVIESFTPTVFAFDPSGFERTPSDEFVSRQPQKALSARTLSLGDAMREWAFEVVYVSDAAELEASLRSAFIDHQIQAAG